MVGTQHGPPAEVIVAPAVAEAGHDGAQQSGFRGVRPGVEEDATAQRPVRPGEGDGQDRDRADWAAGSAAAMEGTMHIGDLLAHGHTQARPGVISGLVMHAADASGGRPATGRARRPPDGRNRVQRRAWAPQPPTVKTGEIAHFSGPPAKIQRCGLSAVDFPARISLRSPP